MANCTVRILGRFPPPFDGQAIASRTLANILASGGCDVHRVNLSAPEDDVRVDLSALARAKHYVGFRSNVHGANVDGLSGTSVWTSISPRFTGHIRDWATIVSAVRSSPLVAVVHHGDFQALFQRFATRRSAIRLVNQLSGIVFLSSGLAEACATWVPDEKRFVIPNTLDSDIHITRSEWSAAPRVRRDGDTFRLLYLSGMIAAKGYWDVLEAVGRLKGRGVEISATFAGRWQSESDRVAFANRVHDLEISDIVTHLGSVSDRAIVSSLFSNADAFLLPTTYRTEAQPLTIIEALNAGTPVIATSHASIPEMIDDGQSGVLVAKSNPDEIANAVERLLPAAVWGSYSACARARYEAVFSPDLVRAQWLSLLDCVS